MTKINTETDFQNELDKSIKMFDVAKPGSSRPASTSRPVIVGHKATITNDPMVTEDAPTKIIIRHDKPVDETPKQQPEPGPEPEVDENAPIEKPELKPTIVKKELSITPDQQPQSETIEPSELDTPNETAATVQPETAVPVTPEEKSVEEPVNSGIVDTLVGKVADKKQIDKEDAELAAKLAEVQKSINSKEFYLPITTSEQRRNTRVILAIILLVIVAGAVAVVFGPERDKINSLLNIK